VATIGKRGKRWQARVRLQGHPPWWRSSGLTCNGPEMISSHGVCDDQDFPHDGSQGDLAGTIVCFDDAFVEVAHCGGMADCSPGGVEQDVADEGSSMTGFCPSAPFSALMRMRGEADERRDLFSSQMAEFRQVGDDDRTDPAYDAQRFG
jgi:hypothetical protein